ncbi:MAG TPA: mechanosensitive ion channel family protein [Streptosporangiaceae bacterium]
MTGAVTLHQWITAIIEVAAGALAGAGIRLTLRWLARHTPARHWQEDDLIFALPRLVLPWGAVIIGLWAAALTLPLNTGARADANHALVALAVLAVTLGAARVAADAVRAGARAHSGVSGSATIFVNITRVLVLSIGLLILLASLGVSITPLLTALGVGGLAVALALQDTLTNLFAGVHILASGKVRPGDFIQLDSGHEGYVVDTNWRNTTIRQLPDNLVIVPNATLAAAIMTNYHRPEPEGSVTVQVGVAYDSDLDHVEQVTIDVGREVMRDVDGAIPAHEPVIRYHTFAESSINFSVLLRTSEVTRQYLVVHEFIKRLHRRYRIEGIDIPFPIRTIVPAPANQPVLAD